MQLQLKSCAATSPRASPAQVRPQSRFSARAARPRMQCKGSARARAVRGHYKRSASTAQAQRVCSASAAQVQRTCSERCSACASAHVQRMCEGSARALQAQRVCSASAARVSVSAVQVQRTCSESAAHVQRKCLASASAQVERKWSASGAQVQRKCSANVVHRCRASAAKVEHECSATAVQVQPRLMFCATPTQILHGRMRYDPAWTVPEVGLIPNHLRGVDSALPRGSHGRPRTTWRCLRVQAATRRPEPTPCHMTTACGSCAVQVRRKCSARAASVQRKCSAGRRSRLQLGLSQEVHVWPEREVLGLASWAAHVKDHL